MEKSRSFQSGFTPKLTPVGFLSLLRHFEELALKVCVVVRWILHRQKSQKKNPPNRGPKQSSTFSRIYSVWHLMFRVLHQGFCLRFDQKNSTNSEKAYDKGQCKQLLCLIVESDWFKDNICTGKRRRKTLVRCAAND